jgi:CRP-like cAMP-binding protein
MSEILHLKANDILMREGEASTSMYYLQKGSLNVTKKKGEKEVQIGIVTEGELVGEMSFIDNHPRSATVSAIDECTLIIVPREKFQQILDTNPKWMISLLKGLIERLRKAKSLIPL